MTTSYETQFRWRRLPGAIAAAPAARTSTAQDLLRRPSLLVAVTVLLVCLPTQVQNVTAQVTVADLAAIAVVGLVTVGLFRGDRLRTPRGGIPFALAVASFAIATVTATDVAASVRGFLRYTELFVLVPIAAAMTIRDRRDTLLVAGAIVTATVFEGAFGVYQYLTRTGASYAGEYVRAVGTFGAEQIMALGALMGYGMIVTLALGLALRGRPRILLLATAAFLAVPLYLSLSRGAWIATAAAVLIVLVIHDWRVAVSLPAPAALAVAVLALGSGPASGPAFGERLTSIFSANSEPDQSVKDRYALWTAAVDMWRDHPVFGVGMKDFAGYRDSYAPVSLSAGSDVDDPSAGFRREPLLSAHNQYLMVLAEQGTVGVLAFGSLLGTLAAGAVRRRRTEPGDDDDATDGDDATGGDAAGGQDAPAEDRFLDLAAPGILVWTMIDFAYGDVGAGPTGVLLAILLGLVARRAVVIPRRRPREVAS
jgi:O-antigen ligase